MKKREFLHVHRDAGVLFATADDGTAWWSEFLPHGAGQTWCQLTRLPDASEGAEVLPDGTLWDDDAPSNTLVWYRRAYYAPTAAHGVFTPVKFEQTDRVAPGSFTRPLRALQGAVLGHTHSRADRVEVVGYSGRLFVYRPEGGCYLEVPVHNSNP